MSIIAKQTQILTSNARMNYNSVLTIDQTKAIFLIFILF